jgi:hypothetical protein
MGVGSAGARRARRGACRGRGEKFSAARPGQQERSERSARRVRPSLDGAKRAQSKAVAEQSCEGNTVSAALLPCGRGPPAASRAPTGG